MLSCKAQISSVQIRKLVQKACIYFNRNLPKNARTLALKCHLQNRLPNWELEVHLNNLWGATVILDAW